MLYYIIAGEASGDLHASNLMKSLLHLDPQAEFRYYGGDLMQAVGGTLVKHYRHMAYMGFIPVLLHLRTILRGMALCKRDILASHPDAVILVDYPGFNLEIAKFVHRHTSTPVFYYISPKIWAWKEYRIRSIRRNVDALFSILPFEVEWYEERMKKFKGSRVQGFKSSNGSSGLRVHYVGNPCVDAVEQFRHGPFGHETFEVFCDAHQLPHKPIIALLAGSRRQEIKDNLRIMLRASSGFDDYQIVIAGAPGIEEDFYREILSSKVQGFKSSNGSSGSSDSCQFSIINYQSDSTYRLLSQSTAALVTSGTATLETALFRVPQVVCYYISCGKFVNILRRMFLKVPYISLVNLIAGREVVTELVADQMNADSLSQQLYDILPGSARRDRMLSDYDQLLTLLGPSGASTRTAEQIASVSATRTKRSKSCSQSV